MICWKCGSTDQATFFLCPMGQSDAPVPNVGAVSEGQGLTWTSLTSLLLRSHIFSKLWCTVCSDTFLSLPVLTSFSNLCYGSSSLGSEQTVFPLHGHQWSLDDHCLSMSCPFGSYLPLHTRNTPTRPVILEMQFDQPFQFDHRQSHSDPNACPFFPAFNTLTPKNWPFTCCLSWPILWPRVVQRMVSYELLTKSLYKKHIST